MVSSKKSGHESPFFRVYLLGGRLCYNVPMRCGQTMMEYILVFVLLMGAVAGVGYIVQAIRAQKARTETLLSSDYP